MPILSTMGLKKIWIADSTSQTDFPAYGNLWSDLGDVYKDTCKLVDADPSEVNHESETSQKKITLYGENVTTVELSLMDPDLAALAKYFGGTITGEAGARQWIRPKKLPYKEWAIKQQPESGLVIGCPCASIKPKFEITYTATGICLVPMVIKYQAQLQANEVPANFDPTQSGGAPAA